MNNPELDQKFLRWAPQEAAQFGKVPMLNTHTVHQLPWFSDAGLEKLINDQPRNRLRVFMSGTDPTQRHRDHQPVDTTGCNAAEILESVRRGKLWVNMQRIDQTDSRFDQLGKKLYSELETDCEHFHPAWINRAFLFVSSPGAMVYLHADYQPNLLWHLRGHKRIFIYPAYDERIAGLHRIEEICAGGEDDLDYRYEIEPLAKPFDMAAGDIVSWPARAPHRVENGPDVNVSLSTFHETHEDYARVIEHQADYFLRQRLPIAHRMLGGATALRPVKNLLYRAASRAGMAQGRPVKEYFAKYRIDPEAPTGVSEIKGGPILAEHSRLAKQNPEHRKAA